MSESLCIFPQSDIELSVITTKADFVRSLDLLIERNSRYINMKLTPINIVTKNTTALAPAIRANSMETIARGIPRTFKTLKKSLSIESFTSSGEIHLYR